MKRLCFYLFFGLATILLSQSASAMSWSDFQKCISSAGSGSTCDLDYSSTAYTMPAELLTTATPVAGYSTCTAIPTTLCIGRSNITITGDQDPSTGNYPTIKRCRDTGMGCTSDGVQAQLAIDLNDQTNITIEHLNFDGSYGDGTGGSPGGHPSTCDPTGITDPPCNYWSEIWAEEGSSNVTIEYVLINYATNEGIELLGANEEVAHSQFNHGANVGVGAWVGSGGSPGASGVVIWDNQFSNNYGSGVAAAAVGLNISSNTFSHNHWGKPDGSNGPELYVATNSDGVTVWYNTVDGEYSSGDPGANVGIEVDPPATCAATISGTSYSCLTGNVVYNHGLEGEIFFYNESAIEVDGDYVYDNGSFTGTGARPYNFAIYGSVDGGSGTTDPQVSLISVTASGQFPRPMSWCGVLTHRMTCVTQTRA